jgi:hypothetical protein
MYVLVKVLKTKQKEILTTTTVEEMKEEMTKLNLTFVEKSYYGGWGILTDGKTQYAVARYVPVQFGSKMYSSLKNEDIDVIK